MWKRTRIWLASLAEVVLAMCADPVLLAPALAIIGVAILIGYLAWRFL